MKRTLSLLIAAALAVPAASTIAAQTYPERPVRLVVPFGAGGSYDPVARVIAVYVGESMKQQIIVDNRGGASGIKTKTSGFTLAQAIACAVEFHLEDTPLSFAELRPSLLELLQDGDHLHRRPILRHKPSDFRAFGRRQVDVAPC